SKGRARMSKREKMDGENEDRFYEAAHARSEELLQPGSELEAAMKQLMNAAGEAAGKVANFASRIVEATSAVRNAALELDSGRPEGMSAQDYTELVQQRQ
ncbi:unnamed protein product, partial [Polarella glacialis]